MITNKDLSIDSENGKIILNGDKYDLGTQGEIDTAVKDVYSVMGQLGAKNLIPYPYSHTTKTQNGVTFTDNGDGTITIVTDENGATANTTFEFQTRASGNLFLKAGKYTATGCPLIAGGGIVFRITNRTVSPYLDFDDTGSGVTFTLQNDLPFGAIFTVSKDTVITTPIVVKPMLRLASDTDNTYEPYAMTNKQLTDQLGTKQDTLTFDTAPTDASTNPVTSGGIYNTIGDLTQTGVTGASVAAQLGIIGAILNFTHFVQIPFSNDVLGSIKAAFANGTIPIDLFGITIGIVRGDAGSQRAVFIAQNQSLGENQTRFGAIYFGSYTAPHYCYKQDSAEWVDTAL